MNAAARVSSALARQGFFARSESLSAEELACPMGRQSLTDPAAPWLGSVSAKPWDYPVTAVIPHLETPDLLSLCVNFLRRQTVRPYIVVVDTGSRPGVLASVEAMRASDLEVHRVAPHGTEHPTEAVGYAIDLGQSLCRTEWMLSVHSDCFVHCSTAIEEMLLVGNGGRSPLVGYESVPRAGSDWWRGMVSHTLTLLHVPTADSLGAGWSLRRLRSLAASLWPKESILDRQDPEVLLNELFRRAGVSPVILGPETAAGIERDARRVHLRGATALALSRRTPQALPADAASVLVELCGLAAQGVPALDCGVRDRLVAAAGFGVAKRGGVAPVELGSQSPLTSDLVASPPAIAEPSHPAEADESGGLVRLESTPAVAAAAPVSSPSALVDVVPRQPDETVLFIAPYYRYAPVLLSALEHQTNPAWRCLLVHDGPAPAELRRRVAAAADARVHLLESRVRFSDWGHSLRSLAINRVAKGYCSAGWVVHTNGDNYYVPGFVETMLACAAENPRASAVYCDMLHNYWRWQPIRSTLQFGEIDCGAVMVRTHLACEIGWPGRVEAADWEYVSAVVERCGERRMAHCARPLFVHN